MGTRRKLLSATLSSAFLLAVAFSGHAVIFDSRSALDLQVNLTHPVLADGSVRFAPGTYDVHFTMTADGMVRAAFFQGGVKRGEAKGNFTVRKAGGEKAHTFESLGFSRVSPSTFKHVGPKPSLEIGAPGSNQIFIWFEQPPAVKR